MDDEPVSKVLSFLDAVGANTVKSLSEINITNPEDIMLNAGSVQIRLGALDRLDSKIEVTKSVISELQQTKHPIAYVDARFDVCSGRRRQ